jgi:TetR/AcrR family transcriptional regulator
MTDQSVSERKHDAILDAARTVFSREGYAESSVDDVAAEAGIGKGTVYLYFKSKEELYVAALARDIRVFADKAREEMESVPTLREKVEALLRVRLEYCRAHEDFLRIYLSESGRMCVKTSMGKELRRLKRNNMRYVASVVQKAIDRHEIRKVSAPALAATIFDIAHGLVERRLLGWKEFQVRGEIAFATDLLWQGIGTGTATRRQR